METVYMDLTMDEKIQKIKAMRPIDDVFFEVLAQNKAVCEEMLQTILEDPKLTVLHVTTQASEKNIYGRSVRLDALCLLGNGAKCNIEVQRSDNDNHLKRARFNASSITVKESNTGKKFEDVIDLYIVYISEFDFLGGGKTIYHIDKVLRETGKVVDDGLHEVFVNTAINDKSNIAELMSCFKQTDVNNPKFPKLSNEVTRLKTERGGLKAMCTIMDDLMNDAAIAECIEGALSFGVSDDQIIDRLKKKYNLSESEAKEQLQKFKNETSQP